MKKTTKILALILTVIMLLSTVSLIASAAGFIKEPETAESQEIDENSILTGDELTFKKTYRMKFGDTVKLDKIPGAEFISADIVSYNENNEYPGCVEINTTDNWYEAESLTAVDYGVAIIEVTGCADAEVDGEYSVSYTEIGSYLILVIVTDPNGMGSVKDINACDCTFRYKEKFEPNYMEYFTWADFDIEVSNDPYTYLAFLFVPANVNDEGGAYVYRDGSVQTDIVGSRNYNLFVVDATGHIFQDTCTITVRYTLWQQIIRFFFLGIFWY